MEKIYSEEMKDTRSGFGAGLVEAGKNNPNVFALTADVTGSVTVNLRLDSNLGDIIGTVTISKTGSIEKYRVFSGKVKNAVGVHDLYICFDKADGDTRLDWWQFK